MKICFYNQSSVLSLGLLFSFSANALSLESTHWLSSSLVGCQQNISSSICSKLVTEPFVGLLWADPGLLYCTNKTPNSLALSVTDRRVAWSLTWSDLRWVGWRIKFPQPGSVASWFLCLYLTSRISQHGMFFFLAESIMGLALIASHLLGWCTNLLFCSTLNLQYLTLQLPDSAISPFYAAILPTVRLNMLINSQGPEASSLGIIAQLTFITVLNDFT